jgi:hypothetical protein
MIRPYYKACTQSSTSTKLFYTFKFRFVWIKFSFRISSAAYSPATKFTGAMELQEARVYPEKNGPNEHGLTCFKDVHSGHIRGRGHSHPDSISLKEYLKG